MFTLKTVEWLADGDIESAILRDLLAYWAQRRSARAMPSRGDIDLTQLRRQMGHLHLLDVEAPGVFRYRLYGSLAGNPGRKDMTGRTTRDYGDSAFSEIVTKHLNGCVAERAPMMHRITATVGGEPYEYEKVILPLSTSGVMVDMLLLGIDYIALPPRLRYWDP